MFTVADTLFSKGPFSSKDALCTVPGTTDSAHLVSKSESGICIKLVSKKHSVKNKFSLFCVEAIKLLSVKICCFLIPLMSVFCLFL